MENVAYHKTQVISNEVIQLMITRRQIKHILVNLSKSQIIFNNARPLYIGVCQTRHILLGEIHIQNQHQAGSERKIMDCKQFTPTELDFSCSICLSLFVQPMLLLCGYNSEIIISHSFCGQCIKQLLDFEIIIKCPYCRQESNSKDIRFNQKLMVQIKEIFPEDMILRQQEVEAQVQAQGNVQQIRLLYGNSFKQLANGKPLRSQPTLVRNKEWTFYVRVDREIAKKYIAKVDVILDPSFEDVVLPLKSEPFQLTRVGVGLGSFRLNFTVYFQRDLKMKLLELYHDISFDPKGSHQVQTITL